MERENNNKFSGFSRTKNLRVSQFYNILSNYLISWLFFVHLLHCFFGFIIFYCFFFLGKIPLTCTLEFTHMFLINGKNAINEIKTIFFKNHMTLTIATFRFIFHDIKFIAKRREKCNWRFLTITKEKIEKNS